MKKIWTLAVLCLLPLAPHAQETTAGGTLAAEASWQALQSRINATNGNVSSLRIDVEAIKKCGLERKIWDGTKCISVMGPSDCPKGFTLIGEANTAEAFCVSSKAEPSKIWIDAVSGCYNKSPKSHLCTASEWSTACVAGVKNMKSTGFEWVSGVVGNKYGAALIGGTTCGNIMTNAANPYQATSRCCIR